MLLLQTRTERFWWWQLKAAAATKQEQKDFGGGSGKLLPQQASSTDFGGDMSLLQHDKLVKAHDKQVKRVASR